MILAIDPGVHGAIALFDPGNKTVETYDIPTYTLTINGKKRTQVDLAKLRGLMEILINYANDAIIEEPHAMPKQGVTSAFTFGHACGVLQMAVVACRIRLTLVRPAQWKKVMGLDADKDRCRKRASQLFPYQAQQWAQKQHDGRAEAALLAYYHHAMQGRAV